LLIRDASPWHGCVRAAMVMLGALLLRVLLVPWSGARTSFLPLAIAILLTRLLCGARTAMAAAALAILAECWFVGSLAGGAVRWADLASFAGIAGIMLLIGTALARSQRQAEDNRALASVREGEANRLAEELDLLIDGASGHAIYMLDPSGRVTIWNIGAERLNGWPEHEAVGLHVESFYPADARAQGKPRADLDRAARDGHFAEEAWRVRRDGSEFLAYAATTALRDDSGLLRGFAKIVSDITQRRATENQLRARETQLSSILSTVPDAMVVIDDGGTIVSFSAAAERLFGYREEDVVGRDVGMLMLEPDRGRHDSYISRYLATGERRIIGTGRVVFAARKDGSSFPVELSIGEALTSDQRLFTGFIRDLTERRRTEAQLEALQSELIHVARLSAMGTMASTLAHELNQPLTAIANYVEAVGDQLVAPDRADFPMLREALQDTAQQALRAGAIVRRLREFVARGEVERTVEALPTLINEASMLGLMGAREAGITAHFDLDPYASPVLVDRVQIQQVLINLIRNACQALSESDQKTLSVISRPDGQGFARITIADTGPGVAPDVAGRLFSAFVTTKADGMGLGLSICRTIVEANGGKIWMAPGEGGGAQFHFTLPLARAQAPDDDLAEEAGHDPAADAS